ncbi:MAG TPA: glycosyltransferase [Steroidobacteraceae bacterium]|jgi:glycosyltransferase involved in cell wall biosynthesis
MSAAANAAPEVTIGLPVYNGERFLAQALDSLLGQTLTDFELVISDNGSEDRTEEICRAYAARDTRVRYVRHEVNRGATWNWNYVVHAARGEIFKWHSANDSCDPRMLQACAEVLRRDPRTVLCYPRTWLVDEAGVKLEQYALDIEVLEERPSSRFEYVREHLFMNNAQSGLIRLAPLRQTGLERPYPHGDMILMAEIALYGTWRLLPEALFYRRIDSQSVTRNLPKAELQAFLSPGRRSMPELQHLRENLDCVRSVLRAPIGLKERAAALRHIARRAYYSRHQLWSDVSKIAGRFRSRAPRSAQ